MAVAGFPVGELSCCRVLERYLVGVACVTVACVGWLAWGGLRGVACVRLAFVSWRAGLWDGGDCAFGYLAGGCFWCARVIALTGWLARICCSNRE